MMVRDLRVAGKTGMLNVILLFAFVAGLWVVNVSYYYQRREYLMAMANHFLATAKRNEIPEVLMNISSVQNATPFPASNVTIKKAEEKMINELEELLEDVNATFKNYQVIYKMSKSSNESFCEGADAVVYVMTMADEGSTLRRQAMREVVFNATNLPANMTIRHRFVMGKFPARADYQQILLNETREYDDILFYNVDEHYRENYIKWHTMHAWHMRHCPNVKHFIKMDDDTVADFDRTFKWIERKFDGLLEGKEKYFVCHRMRGYSPVRDRKNERWYIPVEEFGESHWPDYCFGYFVLTNNDTITDIMTAQQNINLVHMDDCFLTGIVRRATEADVYDFYGVRSGISRPRCSKDRELPYMMTLTNAKTAESVRSKLSTIKKRNCKGM
ncbi:unnamed protein product [Bursaphelenchus xylophilus]|uniref:Hexosyltransferase n=1 Tax=Bursaphelenchus xylophilus TaxID=6326 RepID=A0A1I7S626_BURXY|nr:unnamed protein product [Bursaphelenchus xylophilus]CAG9082348.1 unnamed protein product [Bursaphelenchus xylophilus]